MTEKKGCTMTGGKTTCEGGTGTDPVPLVKKPGIGTADELSESTKVEAAPVSSCSTGGTGTDPTPD